MDDRKAEKERYEVITLLSVLVFLALLWMLTGHYPTRANPYNSYALQAESWLQGRLDLGRDYSWLELAIYGGKYYVSFPPFPSYVLLPFVMIFGSQTPDHLIMLAVNLLSALYLYLLAEHLGMKLRSAMLETLFVLIGSNTVFIMLDGYVWFLAQMLCFLLATASVYYAYRGRGGISLTCWAGAVGCRPMQLLFLPVLVLILRRNQENRNKWYWGIPPVLIGGSYMLLNLLRFGNILEFGHNYLPEHVNSKYGQFSLHYVAKNLSDLFAGFRYTDNGRVIIPSFGGVSMLLVSPIFVVFLFLLLCGIVRRDWRETGMSALIFLLSLGYLFILLCHSTMGGWHFGNRYTNDLLPWVYLGTVGMLVRYPKWKAFQIPLMIWGICLNVVGTFVVTNGW